MGMFLDVSRLFSNAPFLYPMKTENREVFWCYQGLEKEYNGNMITDNYSHFVVATSYIWFFLISSTVIGKIFLTTFPAFSYDFLSLSIFQLCEKLLTLNPLSANSIKWSNPLKQFAWNLLANRLSVFHHFVGLALKVIRVIYLYTIK